MEAGARNPEDKMIRTVMGTWLHTTAICALLLAGGCTIQKAPTRSESAGTGKIFVSAEDPYQHSLRGGLIYLDGILQAGKTTPDTIEADVGNRWIKVEFPAFFPDSQMVNVQKGALHTLAFILDPVNPDVGSAIVTAQDSSSGLPISGGVIFLDGSATNYITPDTLTNLPVGIHTIGVGKIGYNYKETSVDIAAGINADVQLQLGSVAWNGIRILSTVDSTRICIDDRLLPNTTPWVVAGIPDGLHTFSGYREGYATSAPSLVTADLFTYGHQEITLTLEPWPAGIGYNEGKLAPGFSLPSDAGDTVAFGGYRGRVTLVTFWFRDCVPCMEELPDIQQVYAELGAQGFRVLGVNLGAADNMQDLQEVRQLLNLTFVLLLDQNYAVTQAYGAVQFPTNVLVNPSGVVDWYTRSLVYSELYARVQALLNP
jgi:peroxiredoxin